VQQVKPSASNCALAQFSSNALCLSCNHQHDTVVLLSSQANVFQVCPDALLVQWASMPEGEYRAFTVGSLFGRDRLECARGACNRESA